MDQAGRRSGSGEDTVYGAGRAIHVPCYGAAGCRLDYEPCGTRVPPWHRYVKFENRNDG